MSLTVKGVQRTKYWMNDKAATGDDMLWSVTGVLNAGQMAVPMGFVRPLQP